MTLAPERQPRAFRDAGEAADALRAAGHRVSTATRLVLDALFRAPGPVTAEHLAAPSGERPPLELTSVYRNLERLERLGVVSHVHAGHGPGLYALAGEGDREYLVCDRCARVTALEAGALDPLRDVLRTEFGHHARFSHFPIHGLCRDCAGAADGDRVAP